MSLYRKATEDELKGATVLTDEPKRAGRPVKAASLLTPQAIAKNKAARARYAASKQK